MARGPRIGQKRSDKLTELPPPETPATLDPRRRRGENSSASIKRAAMASNIRSPCLRELFASQSLEASYLSAIRRGVTPCVALGMLGFHPRLWRLWMGRGEIERKKPRGKRRTEYIRFVKITAKAMAWARGNAEMRVFRDDPFKWLSMGPARNPMPGMTLDDVWVDAKNLKIDSRVDVDVKVKGRIVHEDGEPLAPISELAKAYAYLCESGLIQPPPQAIEAPPESADGEQPIEKTARADGRHPTN